MLLEGQNAVIYGGGGKIGGAVARAFAREGAKVFFAGRTVEKLEAVAADVRAPVARPRWRRWTRSTSVRSTRTPPRSAASTSPST